MKLKYIATVATASILTIGGNAFLSNYTIASSLNSTDSSVTVAGNPCASSNPCASANPCASDNPCASSNPCASDNPCASSNPCASANSGQFVAVGSGNQTEGTFKVVEEDGKQYIEFSDDFEVSEGPDLEIILHKDPTVEAAIAEEDYISLAPIESFTGTQRYEVPEDVDLDDYSSVAVWCKEFNVTFGYAQL